MKSLKNDIDRKLYIENPNNWSIMRSQNPIRISKLNKTPFIKVEIWTVQGWNFVAYFKDSNCEVIENVKVSELEFSRITVNVTEIVRFLKKNKI
ncbi:MAG: hypothetical protein AB7E61_06335 [Acholeplasmataceae bacterium]